MGGVRGDVIAPTFMQTRIMEMGQPPAVEGADPAMWVRSRQFTGRIVTVTNDQVFDGPVYNYTRECPFIWEEIKVPVRTVRSASAPSEFCWTVLSATVKRQTSAVSRSAGLSSAGALHNAGPRHQEHQRGRFARRADRIRRRWD